MFTFAHPRSGEIRVPNIFLSRLRLLKGRPELAAAGKYTITTDVDRDVVDFFFARVMGDEKPVVTVGNAEQLQALSNELGFTGFEDEIRAVLSGDSKASKDLVTLRGRVDRHDVIIEELQRRVLELERQRECPEKVERRVEETRQNDVQGEIAEAKREAGDLRKDVQRLRSEVSGKASAADVAALSNEVARLKQAEAKRETPNMQDVVREVPEQARSEFVYSGPRKLDGIIAHLTRQCGGNVHHRGVVKVLASSCWGGLDPANAVDLWSNSFLCTNSVPGSWICYDFGERRVAPTSYSIRSIPNVPGTDHPKSWVLEVSNHGSEGSWAVVDTRQNDFELNGFYVARNFKIGAPPSEAFRFVRLRMTWCNHRGDHNLNISGLELFGVLSRAET